MDLPDPSPAVRAAIHAAAAWYEAHKVTGIRLDWVNGERVAVADPNAPPLWARFYEIPTGKPMFWADGRVRWNYNEMEPARRNGYNWYSTQAAAVLKKYAAWRVAQGRADR
jgi:PelA/Pel-15E family pectate lyase